MTPPQQQTKGSAGSSQTSQIVGKPTLDQIRSAFFAQRTGVSTQNQLIEATGFFGSELNRLGFPKITQIPEEQFTQMIGATQTRFCALPTEVQEDNLRALVVPTQHVVTIPQVISPLTQGKSQQIESSFGQIRIRNPSPYGSSGAFQVVYDVSPIGGTGSSSSAMQHTAAFTKQGRSGLTVRQAAALIYASRQAGTLPSGKTTIVCTGDCWGSEELTPTLTTDGELDFISTEAPLDPSWSVPSYGSASPGGY